MKPERSNQSGIDQRIEVTPIVRGLLTEPSGNEDMPHKPVLLRCTGAKTQGGKDALCLEAKSLTGQADAVKEQLAKAIQDFASDKGSKPKAIHVTDLGEWIVEKEAAVEGALPLANKVALVTGAAGAIGYGICRALLEKGCVLVATDLPGERLNGFVEDMEQIAPGRVMGAGIDVTDKDSVAKGFGKAVEKWGGVDIVVHNAGIALVSKLKDLDMEAFRKLERVNVDGTLLVIAEAARLLSKQGIGGDIVIMSTKNVPSPSAGFGAYSSTKAACHQLGRIASLELAADDIRVNMVAPDAVFSEGKYKSGLWEEVGKDRMKARGLDEKGLHEYYRSRNLLKTKVTGQHVANAVLFFVTRQTPTTGATIPVDGGLPDATPR